MNIKTELIKEHIASYINSRIDDFEIDANSIADTNATIILGEIQKALCDENLTDFDVIETIIELFNGFGISSGPRHDF